jgi:putative phosphoribosyl transferase
MRSSTKTELATLPAEISCAGGAVLHGSLELPAGAHAVVLFAHGSGSGRHSPRNRFVAQVLHEAGLGTLLFDLLSTDEEAEDDYNRELRFDIPLLARRLQSATAWVRAQAATASFRIGYFGASTGAAAALIATAEETPPQTIGAVVSRGGRPDLAGDYLWRVHAPTLLIVGGHDAPVIELNFAAARKLRCPHRVEIVPGASHLFEEPGTLDLAADMAARWFAMHLRP